MSKSCDNLDAELEQLVSKLDDYAERFSATAKLPIPCWINSEIHQGLPSDADIKRYPSRWTYIKFRNDEPRRVVWFYEDDLPQAKPLVELLEDLGAELAKLSDPVKSLVYVGWCKHFLPDHNSKVLPELNSKIDFSIEALLPDSAYHGSRLPQYMNAESDGVFEVKYISGRYAEIYLKNLAEAAAHFTIELAERLRTDPQPIYPPTEGELCCSVAEEEERRRPKKLEEILPVIQKLKVRWQRPDDYVTFDPQQQIDDLWADMVPLGWILPLCPKLSEVRALACLTDPLAHRNLWREYQAALSLAGTVAQEQGVGGAVAIEVSADSDNSNAGSSDGDLAKKVVEDSQNETDLQPFTGGEMAFSEDRVELCGVTICYGKRSQTRRTILDLLSKKQGNDSFAFYSGEELAEQAGLAGGENSASGAIRDLRDDVIRLLREKKNIDCGREDVVLSGGPGYRFADRITVQDGDRPEISGITDMDDTSDVRNVRNQDVPNVRNDDDSDDAAGKRRAWILQRLDESHELQSPAVVKQFKCSLKTAQRDLQALNAEDKVEFVGAPRTGYYRLKDPPEPSQQSS